jgi:hypothetical protein
MESDEERVRRILTAQVVTDQAWRLGRAKAVRRHINAKPTALMWALVEEETAELREVRNRADVEAKVLWWTRGLVPPGGGLLDDDLDG